MIPYTKQHLSVHAAFVNWSIGDHTYGMPNVRQYGVDGRLFIGKYTSIANNVHIFLGGNHRIDFVTTYPFNAIRPEARHIVGHPATKGDVRIGSDVWLGDSCTILSGVTIGDGAVIGSHALIARDVAPYAIVGGNPAKEFKKRFSDAVIAELLEAQWWNWPDEEVNQCYELLQSTDMERFLVYCRQRREARASAE